MPSRGQFVRSVLVAVVLAVTTTHFTRATAGPDDTNGMALLSAVANLSGELVRGSGVTTFVNDSEGFYYMFFDRSIEQCAYSATLTEDQGFIIAQPSVRNGTTGRIGLRVVTRQPSGNVHNAAFSVIVFCHR